MNIACNRRTTLNEILDQLRELMGVEVDPDYQPPRAGDVKHSLADVSLARESIGYEPKIHFQEGLARAIDWYRENLA